jgi:D-alanyl-D-alanine carboxypeptidase (penicillin-binding protein 5/6)
MKLRPWIVVLLVAASCTANARPAHPKPVKSSPAAATPAAPAPAAPAQGALTPPATAAASATPQPKPGAAAGETPIPNAPTLSAKSYVLMDFLSGQVLAAKDADARVAPASITKVMTSYVVSAELKAGKIKLDDPVYVSEKAWRGGGASTDGSTSFLQVNKAVPLKDLLYGMIIQSGNDASIALAEHIAGSEETFVQMMNSAAAKLGLSGTHFANSTGLPAEDHYTTAADIGKLSLALIRDFPDEYKIYAIRDYTINGITQHNRNTLLWRDGSVDGIKTGHHSQAGYCLAASAKRDETRLVAVVMGTASEKIRADEAQSLLGYGFRFFESHKIYDAGAKVADPELWKGIANKAAIGVEATAVVTIPRGAYTRLKASMDVQKPLLAPLTKGQTVGTLKVALDGKPVYQAPLVALADYPEAGFFKRLSDQILLWWSK